MCAGLIVWGFWFPVAAWAASSGSTFCVGVAVVGSDGVSIDTNLQCEFARAGGVSEEEEEDDDDDQGADEGNAPEPERGGGYHHSRDRNSRYQVDILRRRLELRPGEYHPAAPEEEKEVTPASFIRGLRRRVIGIFQIRVHPLFELLWEEEEPEDYEFDGLQSSSVRGVRFAAAMSRRRLPRNLWDALGFRRGGEKAPYLVASVRPFGVLFEGEDAGGCESENEAGECVEGNMVNGMLATLSVPGLAYLRAHPSELVLWGVLILVAGIVLVRRAWGKKRPAVVESVEEVDDVDEFQGE